METGDVEMDNETLRKRVPAETRITASRSNTHLFFRKVRLAQCLRLQLGVTITLLLLACNHSAAPTPSEPTTTAKQAKVNARHLDAAQVQRLKTIMIPLIKGMNNPLPLKEVKVAVLDDQAINAANAGKGQFYVTAGLLEKASDEQLRGVLAHELAHEDLGHVAKTKVLGTGLSIGALILGQIVPGSGIIAPTVAKWAVMQPFSRQEEYQADEHGVDILNRAGYNGKQVMADTLRWLLRTSGSSGGFLSDHPGTEERIKRVEQLH